MRGGADTSGLPAFKAEGGGYGAFETEGFDQNVKALLFGVGCYVVSTIQSVVLTADVRMGPHAPLALRGV